MFFKESDLRSVGRDDANITWVEFLPVSSYLDHYVAFRATRRMPHRVLVQQIRDHITNKLGIAVIRKALVLRAFWPVMVKQSHARRASVISLRQEGGLRWTESSVVPASSVMEVTVIERAARKSRDGWVHPVLRIEHDGGHVWS